VSTIKSSAENLTLNADGANNDIIFQSNGSNVATLDQAGLLTATSASFSTADNTDTLTLTSTDADGNSGPNVRLYRNSGSPYDDDVLGQIDFEGRNNNSQDVVYSQINSRIMSTTDGSEDGNLYFKVMKAGTLREAIMCDRTEVVVNNDSVDMNFRVESDTHTNALFVDGGTGNVGIGVNPKVWNTGWSALQIGGMGSISSYENSGDTTGLVLSSNAYLNTSGTWSYIGVDQATAIDSTDGKWTFKTGGSSAGSADAAITWTNSMIINNNGRVEINADGLGTNYGGAAASIGHSSTSPILELFVNHTSAFGAVKYMNGNGEVGSVSITGSGVTFNTSSDYRLKENVDYTWDATTRLKQLKPARFNFIADDTNTLIDGFLAHEVSSVVPEAITGEKDATNEDDSIKPQGIDQSKLVPLLVKTIQELEARITALEA
jgi:hypothetical protein